MLEVVYLISRAKQSGPVNQALNILIGLNRQPNVHATLITLAPEGSITWLNRFKDKGINIVQLNQPYLKTFKAINLLKRYISENDVKIVHSAGFRADFVNMMMGKLVKKVSTQRCQPNEMVEKFPRFLRPPFEWYHLHIIKKLDSIVACSKALQKHFYDIYNIKVGVVQNGVNTDFFVPLSLEKKEELRKELGLSLNKITYVTVGRLGKRKNFGLIIDAFKNINREDIQLIIVGSGPLEDELKNKSAGDNRIIFVGLTPNPIVYYQASDIFISSSFAEGLPNTVLESLSCGLPCILSEIEPHKELLANSSAGILFNHFEVISMQNSIISSFSWNIPQLSVNARQLAVDNYGIDRLAKEYLSVYNNIL